MKPRLISTFQVHVSSDYGVGSSKSRVYAKIQHDHGKQSGKSTEECLKKCRKQQKKREIADYEEKRGFGPKSRICVASVESRFPGGTD